MEKFLATILGNTTGGEMLGYMVLGIIGASIYLGIKISNRNKTENDKPYVWSWAFFFKDNGIRMFLTLGFVFVWASHGHSMNHFFQKYIPGIGDLGTGTYIAIGFLTDVIVLGLDKSFRFAKKWVQSKFEIKV